MIDITDHAQGRSLALLRGSRMPPKKKQQEEEQDKLTRIAIVSTDKCKPKRCRWEIR